MQPGDLPTVTVKIYSGTSASGIPVQTLMTTRDLAGFYSVDSAPLAPGTYTAQAEQSDSAGNTGYSSANTFQVFNYTIDYLPPLDDSFVGSLPVINAGKNGRVVPVKVEIFVGGVEQTDAQLAAGTVTIAVSRMISCSSSVTDAIETYADAGSSSAGTNQFRWTGDGSGFWIYNLDTKALGLQTDKCYRLDVYIESPSRFQISNERYAVYKPVR